MWTTQNEIPRDLPSVRAGVETSGSFAPEPVLREDPGVLIFRRENPGKQFSHAEASAVAEAGLSVARGALFGRHFELLGALMTPATEGMELQLAWRCVSAAVLDRHVVVHFVDDSGKILSQADFPQDAGRAPVMAGAEWVDHVLLRPEKLVGAVKVAIALYAPGREMLTIVAAHGTGISTGCCCRSPRRWRE